MKWEDEGILLSARNHGEHNAIVEILTARHGRQAGLVKYAFSKKNNGVCDPGMQANVVWTARLSEQLGVFLIDKVKSRTSALIKNRQNLFGFNSMISLLLLSLPEREPFPEIYKATKYLLDMMETDSTWLGRYVRWELLLLAELGFGLDLSKCAVTGKKRDLIYVSPKTGRAISEKVGKPWGKKLLELPKFLTVSENLAETNPIMISKGMILTGFFFEKWLLDALNKLSLPEARQRFLNSLND